MTETDIQKIAETLRTELGKIDVEVSFRRNDFRKFFAFAILANVISSTVIMTTVGYLARLDTKKKEEAEKQERTNVEL